MSDPNARSLSNNFQDVRLVSLASWSKASEINPRDKGGPYVVTQQGYDPYDPTMTPDEFILGRSGKWLSLGTFYALAVDERRAEFVFGTAAEAMQAVGSLSSRVVILGRREGAVAQPANPASDDMAAAIQSGRERQPGAA
jgi:hypothetical protein